MLRVTRFNAVPKPPPRTWRASLWMLASVCARFRYKSRMQSEEELVRTFMVDGDGRILWIRFCQKPEKW